MTDGGTGLHYAGEVPRDIDERVARRDRSPLGGGVLVRYQRIGLEKSPARNLRWELHEDGAVHLARHSGDTSDWRTPFDTRLPPSPSAVLPADRVEGVRRALDATGFASQPPYQVGEKAKGGRVEIVSARHGAEPREVMYENAENALLDVLREIPADVEG